MQILPFHTNDQEKTATFMRTIYQEMGWKIETSDGLDNLESFFHIPTAEGFLFVVKEATKIIATGGCIKLNESDALMKRFYIDKDYRGKGLAQKFLETLVDASKTLSVSRVVIDVSKKNVRAIRFYEKCGFLPYTPKPSTLWPESSNPEIFNYYFLDIN